MKSKCYLLREGAYGSAYTLGVFLYKKDAVTTAREGNKYVYNKKDNLFNHCKVEGAYRFIEELPLCTKHVDGSDLL